MFKKIKNLIKKIESKTLTILCFVLMSMLFFSLQTAFGASTFNTLSGDYPFRVANNTQDPSNWKTSLSNVKAGDELRFNTYYHNTSSDNADNTKITLSLSPSGSATSFTATSTISADGFNSHVQNISLGLSSSQSITIKNNAKWYHNYNGSAYQIDDVSVSVSGTTATVNLGQIKPGGTPNDGFVVIFADVSNTTITPPPTSPKSFNTDSGDYPFRVANNTQDPSNWKTSLSNVKAGDELRFNTYYHNTSTDNANNTKITLSLSPSGSATSFTATSTISADGFNSHVQNISLGLSSSQSITIKNNAKWYHNYNGSAYQIDDVSVSVSGTTATVNLGQIKPGGTPNDGMIIFFGTVSSSGGGGPTLTADAGNDQTVTPGTTVQLNGSGSTGSGLTYAWSCNNAITLSNTKIVNPTFTVPSSATSGTVYTCTLTVTDASSKTASDSVKITVSTSTPSSGGGGGGGPIVYYGGKISAEILDVTDNNDGTVKLNGKIKDCEKNNCSAKFIWGTSEKNLTNTSETIKGLKAGNEFSYTLKNLIKGKAYYVGLKIEMESKSFEVETPIKFIAKPDKPSLFNAVLKDNTAQITWKLGEGGDKVLIKRGVNTCPKFNDTTAPTIYFGEDEKFIDNALGLDQTYCYRAWMISSDGLDIIFSDSVDAMISTAGVKTTPKTEEKPSSTTSTTTTIPSRTQTQTIQKVTSPNFKLSLNNFVRNSSLDKLEWQKSVNVSANDDVEFYIELENKGNVSLYNLIILNTIKSGLKDIKNVVINDVKYSNKILERAFIKELKPSETIKITFSAKVEESADIKEITLLTEAYSNQTKNITDVVKVIKKDGHGNEVNASLFDVVFKGQLYPWLILILIIIILLVIYIISRKRKKKLNTK